MCASNTQWDRDGEKKSLSLTMKNDIVVMELNGNIALLKASNKCNLRRLHCFHSVQKVKKLHFIPFI